MGADIRLLPGVTPGMNIQVASLRENFVTLQASIVLLPGVSLKVSIQVT